MADHAALRPEQLARRCDPASLGFATTAGLPEQTDIVGQERALEAIDFAIRMPGHGYNVVAMGPEGTGKTTAISQRLEREAAQRPAADDWCYVNDFGDARRPRALRLPAGRGGVLRSMMNDLIREVGVTIPAALESDDYRARRMALEEAAKARREAAMTAFEKRASKRGIAVVRTPIGIGMAPARGKEVLGTEEFDRLPETERRRVKSDIAELETELANLIGSVPRWEGELRRQVQALNEEVVRGAVEHVVAEVREAFADQPAVLEFLTAAENDIVERAEETLSGHDRAESPLLPGAEPRSPFHRCTVNLIVDHAGEDHAPVVYEDLPTQPNLLGKIEHVAHLGTLLTDFTLIKAGALHRANGGYLVIDVRRLLQQPFAWEELKRALRAHELRLDGLPAATPWISTASVEPQPIPLDVKVVLIGERQLLGLLALLDPDVAELFRIQADFDDRIERTPEAEHRYATTLASIASRNGLRPLDASAVAAAIDHAARAAGHAGRLSTNMRDLADLVREADRLAADDGVAMVERRHLIGAVDGRRRRAGRIAEEMRRAMVQDLVHVETDGTAVGQVNGLSVIEIGEQAYGWPARITAGVRLGRGDVVDIEREVDLGGPIHSKGVLILAGFLGARFGRSAPLAVQASLVFEQTYGGVEGDSASMAELCALLSAIGEIPLDQSIAITGSVDQLGRGQAIGGVDEKIEGYYELCAARGLTGRQGVLIPAANVQSLMLRDEVIEAVADGRFSIRPYDDVDDAMATLTGLEAGVRGADGSFPAGSVNERVATRLTELAEIARAESGATGGASPTQALAPTGANGR